MISNESRVENRESKTESEIEKDLNPKSEIRNLKSRVPLLTDEPQTLSDIFFSAKEKHNRSDVLNFKRDGEWQQISSEEMISRAENIALGLYDLGLRKGDRARDFIGKFAGMDFERRGLSVCRNC